MNPDMNLDKFSAMTFTRLRDENSLDSVLITVHPVGQKAQICGEKNPLSEAAVALGIEAEKNGEQDGESPQR